MKFKSWIHGLLLTIAVLSASAFAAPMFDPGTPEIDKTFSIVQSPFDVAATPADADRQSATAFEVAVINSDIGFRSVVSKWGKFPSNTDVTINDSISLNTSSSGTAVIGSTNFSPSGEPPASYSGTDRTSIERPPLQHANSVIPVARSGSY